MKLSSTFVALCSLAPLFGAHGQEAPPTRRERQRARREAEEANAAEAAEVDIPLSPLAPERGSIIPGEYIVQIDNEAIGADGLTVEAVAGQFGISEEKIFTRTIQGFFIEDVSLEQIAEIAAMDVVAKVEPNRVVTIQTVGEPIIRELGDFDLPGLEDVPYGTDRVGGGRPYRGGGTAWVIDTGVSLTHLDLRVDADRSVSFVDGEPTANDGNGHGTHVAGTIAARNNAFGVRGVAAGATVVGVKVLGAGGSGSTAGVIEGVEYVAQNAEAGDVANLSLGGGQSDMMDEAVIGLANSGVLVAVAAGNEGERATQTSPARANACNLYTVSAIDENDDFAAFSNFGNPPVDFAAPGVRVLSTYINNRYAELSGTSMASPHMAGVLLALGGNRNPGADGRVNNDADNIADPIVSLSGRGGGFLDRDCNDRRLRN